MGLTKGGNTGGVSEQFSRWVDSGGGISPGSNMLVVWNLDAGLFLVPSASTVWIGKGELQLMLDILGLQGAEGSLWLQKKL